ncbi:tRNA threonylcarbamoyladenosine dehydratase, partial [bacterium]|nr:tRNA threonylcarbamoyladenosine dehydratase [bacterium]
MDEMFSRTKSLIGANAVNKLAQSSVAVFGIGGVGSYAVEALVRSGIGKIDLIDNDNYSISNINRQLYANLNTLNKPKVDTAKEHIAGINPNCLVNTYNIFYAKENLHLIELTKYDYVIDAIDTVSSKIELIVQAKLANVPIISSMGAGNKLHPEMFEISDIYKTSVCPLAKIMRYELKKRGVKSLKVVFSKEKPIKFESDEAQIGNKRIVPGSISFVPSAVGLIIAGEVIRD